MGDDDDEKEVKTEPEYISLKVLGQDGTVVHFNMKEKAPFGKLMKAYCDRAGLTMGAPRFLFDGQTIIETDTPLSLKVEDGDIIEVYERQTGGTTSSLFH